MKLTKSITFPKQYLILLILWAIVQGGLLWKNGIATNLEAIKYINEANHFLQFGNFSSNNYYLYSVEILLIAIALKLKLGFVSVVVFQIFLNLVATYLFYQLASVFLKRNWLAVLATILFIINIPYQQYNSFLYTESLFYSLSIIFSSYLLRQKELTFYNISFIILMLLILSITRPTGILFFVATAIYIFFNFLKNVRLSHKILMATASVILFLAILNVMLQTGGSLDFMLPFKRENIICGVNTTSGLDIKTIKEGNTVKGIFYYIFNNNDQFFKLAKLKTISFFGYTRDYYSSKHNLFLILFFYPFYVLSIIGIWKKIRQKDRKLIFLLTIIALFWVTTLLTCDDWHNRFVLTVSPFIFLTGLAAFIKKDAVKSLTDQEV